MRLGPKKNRNITGVQGEWTASSVRVTGKVWNVQQPDGRAGEILRLESQGEGWGEHGRLEDGGVTRGWGMFRMRDTRTTTTTTVSATVLFLDHYVMDG